MNIVGQVSNIFVARNSENRGVVFTLKGAIMWYHECIQLERPSKT